MPYSVLSFSVVVIFALVHLYAKKLQYLDRASHSRFLSAGGGIAIAYVFVDLLPKLAKNNATVKESLQHLLPYIENHAYVIALLGFLLFFAVDRSQGILENQKTFFWLSMGSYALFNFFVGYAVVDKANKEVQPLALFTLAMTLHYFINDYSLTQAHGEDYHRFGKWILIGALFIGWLTGFWFALSQTAIALISAFIGGGIIMNVTRHELPANNPHSLSAFLSATALYTLILLGLNG